MITRQQYYLLYLVILSFPTICMSQNLVKNGGFEHFFNHPDAISQIHLADEWSPVSITADLFCVPEFYNIPAHTGNCYAGFGLWVSTPDFITTESFKQKLIKPLEAGKQYFIKFYAASANWSGGNCAKIEVFGTTNNPAPMNNPFNYIGQLSSSEFLGASMGIAGEDWRLVELCFTPTRDLPYLVMSVSNSSCDQYFYIDDIELYELETQKFFADEVSLCIDEPLILGTAISNTTFQWQDGSTDATYEVTEPGLHWWTVDTVCNLRLSDTILVKDGRIDLDDNFLGADSTLCQDETLLLNIASNDEQLQFEWNDGSIESTLNVSTKGTYQVLVQKEDCQVTDEIDINYITCADCALNAPNVFSPNNDGINDEFQVFSNCPILQYSLHIFDRWGALVFQTDAFEKTWDGRSQKQLKLANGIYVYTVKYQAEQYGETVSGTFYGEVMIMK